MKTEQSFSYTGSSTYTLNNVSVSENSVSLFDELTGFGGVDYVPYHGSTVTVMTGAIDSTDDILKLQPSLNNKLYYLVSDVQYGEDDKDLIISLATEIPVVLNGGTLKYEGTFVFNNPNDYEYIYLIWDYTDTLNSGSVSYSGDATTRNINIGFGTSVGRGGISYDGNAKPTRYILKWNGSTVGDTGYVGLNSTANYNALIALGIADSDIAFSRPINGLVDNSAGAISFSKTVSDIEEALLNVYSPLDASFWTIDHVPVSLKPYYTSLSNGTLANVGAQTANVLKYHNGTETTPVDGDRVYSDSDGLTPYDGANSYHIKSPTSMGAPYVSGGVYNAIDTEGLCYLSGFVDCQEAVVPFISQTDITLKQNVSTNIIVQASSNPTSWTIASTCNRYSISGGVKGGTYTYTSCESLTASKGVINANSTIEVTSTTLPVVTLGTGVVTSLGTDISNSLPAGLAFLTDSGTIEGTPIDTCSKSITLTATNCKGSSISKTINISVVIEGGITPFPIDVENFGDTGDSACAITPIYSLMYHNGVGRVPAVGDKVFRDPEGITPFIGGERWYKIDNATYSIKIGSSGYVGFINECPAVTTTTTSTTTTTTTTTLPAGGAWFTATLCSDPTVTAKLFDSTSSGIIATNIVKTSDNNCWTITASSTASYPYIAIENPVVIYANCTVCQGITTTTTTTTTTTAPVYTAFNLGPIARASSFLACTNNPGVYTAYYHNGGASKPIVGDFTFTDAGGTLPFNGLSSWYYMPNSGDYAIRIANTGQVLAVVNCAGVTTTTTTTTLPTNYYIANSCINGAAFKLKQVSSTIIPDDTVVKGALGGCYTIKNITTAGTSYDDILFTYSTCLDCQGVTTTTTTSTTTTSTTTTSTTTSTTTTLPPLTRTILKKGTIDTVCSGTLGVYYIDGPIGTIGEKLYVYSGGYSLATSGYYLIADNTVAYEWNGTAWTGNTKVCS